MLPQENLQKHIVTFEHVLLQQTGLDVLFSSQKNALAKLQLQADSYNAIYLQPEGSCAFYCMSTTDQGRDTTAYDL